MQENASTGQGREHVEALPHSVEVKDAVNDALYILDHLRVEPEAALDAAVRLIEAKLASK